MRRLLLIFFTLPHALERHYAIYAAFSLHATRRFDFFAAFFIRQFRCRFALMPPIFIFFEMSRHTPRLPSLRFFAAAAADALSYADAADAAAAYAADIDAIRLRRCFDAY